MTPSLYPCVTLCLCMYCCNYVVALLVVVQLELREMNKEALPVPTSQTQSRSSLLVANTEPYHSREGSVDFSLDDADSHQPDADGSESSHSDKEDAVFPSESGEARVEVHRQSSPDLQASVRAVNISQH